MPFPSSPTVGQTYTTPGGVTFEWVASGYWKAVGGGGSATPAPSGVTFPTWTTATRPASPSAGDSGWNTDTGSIEVWNGATWEPISPATGNVEFPSWTTATRPASPSAGVSGWNTDTGSIEVWNGSAWSDVGGRSVPTWTTATRPTGATAGTLGLNTDLGFLEVYDGASWNRIGNTAFFSGATQPTNMAEGDEWLDTSVNPPVLKKYVNDGSGASWMVDTVYSGDVTLWSSVTKEYARLQASDAAGGDQFGYSVSLSSDGNTLAVGAYPDDNSGGTNAGSVYVFIRSGSAWTEQTRLQASDAAVSDEFGWSVSLSSDGNTLAVGANRDDNSGGTDTGSVYVFTRSGSTWTEQTRLQASDAAEFDYFGWSVSLSSDGNTLAVGAYVDDNSGGVDTGSVYVFTRSESTWTEQTRLQASDAAASDKFGFSVSLSSDGNTLAVGVPEDDNSGGTDAGSVYVFTRSGSTWTEQTRLQASLAPGDQFGYSVSLSSDGNTLAAGAIGDDIGGSGSGSVYVFTRSGSSWAEQTRLQASDTSTGDLFGYSVSLSSDGNTLSTGARVDDNSAGTDAGSVYVFARSGSTWTEQTRLQASLAPGDQFGYSVSLSSDGNSLAVGSPYDDNSGGTDAGSVYMFGSTVALSTFAGTITPSSLTITEGEAFTATFTTTGGTSPYTYAVQMGSLPAGLTLSGATLSGTPTATGSYFFIIRVTDSTGAVYDAMFSGSVVAVAFGSAWTDLTSVSQQILSIQSAGGDIFAVGSGPLIVRSSDNGLTWNDLTSAVGFSSNSAEVVIEQNGYIYVAGTSGALFRSQDNGVIWQDISAAVGFGSGSIRSVASNGSVLIASGTNGNGDNVVRRSLDNGSTWVSTSFSSINTPLVVYYVGTTLFAAGGGGMLQTSSDDGDTWTDRSFSLRNDGGFGSNTVFALTYSNSASRLFAAGMNGKLAISDDLGINWTDRSSALSFGSDAVYTVSSSGSNVIVAGANGRLHASEDSGGTWSDYTTDAGFAPNAVYASTTLSDMSIIVSAGGLFKKTS